MQFFEVFAIFLVGLVIIKGNIDFRLSENLYPTSSHICENNLYNGYMCKNCTTLVYCKNSKEELFIENCPDKKLCIGGRCVTASKCPSPDVPFICSNPGIFPDPGNCTKYHICVERNNNLEHFEEQCEGNENGLQYGYNPEKLACSDALSNGHCRNNYVPFCKQIFDVGTIPRTSIYYECNYYTNPKLDNTLLYPYQRRCDNGKGTDITEAFETHHLSNDPPKHLLQKYFVKKISKPRVSPYTFKDDGFYKTLKKRVRVVLKTVPENSDKISNIYTDLLLLSTLTFACLASAFSKYSFAVLSGISGSLLLGATHNYVHRPDNFRMMYGSVLMMSPSEFRVLHILSHHLFPNSRLDLQLICLLPLINLYPEKKSFIIKYFIRLTSIISVFPFLLYMFSLESILEIVHHKRNYIYGILPLTLPIAMHYINSDSILSTIILWQIIIMVASALFGTIASTTTHIHPDLYMEGDARRPKQELDWGIHQLDTVYDRKDVVGNHFIALVTFGDHALHHLFPTLDQSYLIYLYPVLEKTLHDFNIKGINMTTSANLFIGFYKQAGREAPKLDPPSLTKVF
ncbi:hypothetical protein FQR65_LT06446 [Abscondita terminalis]|nr:hypothetical protein FQR65_LT06446 [Abscondita terminalis]